MFLRCRRKRIRVQDQSRLSGAHISASTSSNASSITLLIRLVSLRKILQLAYMFHPSSLAFGGSHLQLVLDGLGDKLPQRYALLGRFRLRAPEDGVRDFQGSL